MQIKKIGVVGAGTMGSSITMALISSGLPVCLKDINDQSIASGLNRIDKFLDSKIKKGLDSQTAHEMKALIQTTTELSSFSEVDFVIEAAAENIEIKKQIFADLDKACPKYAIFATNTSSLPITQIAHFTNRAQLVIGMHFFNPAHLMKLVEVIPSLDTSDQTITQTMDLANKLGKLAVKVDECPSFLVNRLLGRYMNEAIWCLQEGIATVEEIDQAACDYLMPIGPLALRDMNGADIGLNVASFNYQEYGDRFLPPECLSLMVKENMLGQKTGSGFYLYDKDSKKKAGTNPAINKIIAQLNKGANKGQFKVERLFLPMINEAFLVLQERICQASDLDKALMAGLGMRKGPLTLASEIGLSQCLSELDALFKQYGERFRPAFLLKRYVWGKRQIIV